MALWLYGFMNLWFYGFTEIPIIPENSLIMPAAGYPPCSSYYSYYPGEDYSLRLITKDHHGGGIHDHIHLLLSG